MTLSIHQFFSQPTIYIAHPLPISHNLNHKSIAKPFTKINTIMHQAIPYRSWRPVHNPTTHFTPLPLIAHSQSCDSNNNDGDKKRNMNNDSSPKEKGSEGKMVLNMVSENAVIVIGKRGCCMSHVVKRLLLGLGVNPGVYEVEEKDEASVATQLEATIHNDGKVQFPVVFIGGKMFGGLERVMATHISGELVPILKQAGALWL